MLKTWSFWKAFFIAYIALVAGIWGFVEAYTYFEDDSLKQLLGSYWWIIYYVIPLFVAFSAAILQNAREETQAETLDQRNRRVMLNHVENFWVKGILEKSLHGAALLELGIKEDPSAINYPWAIKRESTNETLPAGKSMFEIFEEIGAGRSLLILGAPGSGKTTMLLELARQLIERARKDETDPIPVVFNLASWTEKQILADWLAEQLNSFYYVPKKTALKWISENKMLLLLDGLDEVKQESRAKCVETINQFRTERGLTALVVCSRIEEYQTLYTKLSLEGAITLQPLTSKQVNAYFDKFGKSLASVKQLLKQDQLLRELTEIPLMLSIMTLAYKDKKPEELPPSKNIEDQRKYLFDAYINRMFERSNRTANSSFTKQQTLHYLSWLAHNMLQHNTISYQIETMQTSWLEKNTQLRLFRLCVGLIGGLLGILVCGVILSLNGPINIDTSLSGLMLLLIEVPDIDDTLIIFGLSLGLIIWIEIVKSDHKINMIDKLIFYLTISKSDFIFRLIISLFVALYSGLLAGWSYRQTGAMILVLSAVVTIASVVLIREQIEETTYPGQRLKYTLLNATSTFIVIAVGLLSGLIFWFGYDLSSVTVMITLALGLIAGLEYGISMLIKHYALRFILIKENFLPKHLILFLENAVNLIFLRRVGGSYVFVHRLLMEHFAEMVEEKR